MHFDNDFFLVRQIGQPGQMIGSRMSPTPDKENVLLTLNKDVFSLVLKVWPYQWMKVETLSKFKHENHLQFLIPELLVPSNSYYDERHWSFVKSISRKRILLKEVLHIWALQISSKFPLTYLSQKTKLHFLVYRKPIK